MLHQLDVKYDYDFLLIAISCFEKDYRMCWLINKQFNIDLARTEDIEVEYKDAKSVHSVFSGEFEDEHCHMTLIKNRDSEGVLLQELAQIDYLLKIEDYPGEPQELTQILREISQVKAVYQIQPENLRHKEHLIID